MATEKKQSFLGGAAVLAFGIMAVKVIGAVFKIPLRNILGEGGSGISEGQAQRIAVARALLGKGKILLMDESTGALDGETEKRLIENLHSRKDITVLFITHRDTVLEKCGRIITVSNGRISEN